MFARRFLEIAALACLAFAKADDYDKELVKKTTCNADNLLRLMRGDAHLADSQAFCPGYICQTPPPATTTSYYVWTLLSSLSVREG